MPMACEVLWEAMTRSCSMKGCLLNLHAFCMTLPLSWPLPLESPNPDCTRLSCEAQKTVNLLIGALRVSKYQFRKASQGFTFLEICKPSSCTSAMFFYPAKADAGNSERFRRAACQNQRRNTQGPSETGEIANVRMELLVGLHTTDSPLPGKIKEDGSHMGRTDAFFYRHV